MRFAALACTALVTGLAPAGVAHAQMADAPSTENGRYAMTPTQDGFLRLDTRTGAVTLCTVKDAVVRCAPSADERGALESEIARLSKENSDLRAKADGKSSRLAPTDEDVDKAIGYMEKFMRRMMQIMRDEPQQKG